MRKISGILCCIAMVSLVVPLPLQAEAEIEAVSPGKKVQINYILTVDGQVVDASEEAEPFEYIHGQGQIVQGLESQMAGMKVGDSKNILVAAKDGYGEINPDAVQEVPNSELSPGFQPVAGQMLGAVDERGNNFNAIVKEVRKDSVLLDFNHPLAGKDLKFDITIVDME